MVAKELRGRSSEELRTELRNLKESLFNTKFRKTIGQLEDTSQFKKLRKDIARINTILRLRELGLEK
jgi:large subunit ribosomal protein L29